MLIIGIRDTNSYSGERFIMETNTSKAAPSQPQAQPVTYRYAKPEMPTYLLRLSEVEHAVKMSRSTIYRMINKGTFPPPVRLGERSSAWRESDVMDWINGLGYAEPK